MDSRPSSLFILSGVNPLRGYGPIAYLAEALARRGLHVELFAPIPRPMLGELSGKHYKINSYFATWYGRLPRIRLYLFGIYILGRGLREKPSILCCDLHFYREAVWLKKARPDLRLIHFCEELFLPEEKKLFPMIRHMGFYARHADCPDLVIDVDPNRAKIRRERYGLTKETAVLPNTIPRREIPEPAPPGTLARLAGGELPAGLPVLVYTGGVHSRGSFETIVEAIRSFSSPLFFLLFCHGHAHQVRWLRRLVGSRLGPRRGRVCLAVPRTDLLGCLGEADLGLVYYPYAAHPTLNQLYCAPTKALEYLACGLPVIGSANPSLRQLLETEGLGCCARDDSVRSLQEAILRGLRMLSPRRDLADRLKTEFSERLCFESVSERPLDRIVALCGTGDSPECRDGRNIAP